MEERETPAHANRSNLYAVLLIAVFVITVALSQVVHA
jgi:hypothetical protein